MTEINIPQHIAIILDGNGRWAKAKGMPRNYGHKQGSKNVEIICEEAYRMGVKYLTVYAFSTENWNRPDSEVEALMNLLSAYMKTCIKTAKKNNMRVRVIGDVSKLDTTLQKQIMELEESSKDHDGLQFQIALNYGSRDEITRGIRKLTSQSMELAMDKLGEESDPQGKTAVEILEKMLENITPESIANALDTAGIPDPDLLIRTSGEQRLSNFLLWQLAYTEFYFTEVHWPDFTKEELEKAIAGYNKRDRRFGKAPTA